MGWSLDGEVESKDFFFKDERSNSINADRMVAVEEELMIQQRKVLEALSLRGQQQVGYDIEVGGDWPQAGEQIQLSLVMEEKVRTH